MSYVRSSKNESKNSDNSNNIFESTIGSHQAIALLEKSIHPFTEFSQRKAADLILQFKQLILEEERYGNSKNADAKTTSGNSSSQSQHSSSLSDTADSETDLTSVPSDQALEKPDDSEPETGNMGSDAEASPSSEQCNQKLLHFCTRDGCPYSTSSFTDWKRHEEGEKHWPQERFMCLEFPSAPAPVDVVGSPVCQYCLDTYSPGVEPRAHYLNCQSAKEDGTTFGRKDHLMQNLREAHGMPRMNSLASSWKYGVDSRWSRQCGFCGDRFQDRTERMQHIAQHFRDGAKKSS